MKDESGQKEQKPYRTQGLLKLVHTFETMVYTPEIQEMVKEARILQDSWLEHRDPKSPFKPNPALNIYKKHCLAILTKIGVYGVEWEYALQEYIDFNELDNRVYDMQGWENDVCRISDTQEDIADEEFAEEFDDPDDLQNHREQIKKHFPIMLRISPYATIRDIHDYLKKMRTHLTEMQERYKEKDIKIGAYRASITRKRNNFIFENKALPRKEIEVLVKKEFNSNVDQVYTRNIISKKKKGK